VYCRRGVPRLIFRFDRPVGDWRSWTTPPFVRKRLRVVQRAAGVVFLFSFFYSCKILIFFPLPSFSCLWHSFVLVLQVSKVSKMKIEQMLDHTVQDTHTETNRRGVTTSSSPISGSHTTSGAVKTSKMRRRQTKAACLGCRQRKSKVGIPRLTTFILHPSHIKSPISINLILIPVPVRRRPSIL
jgi:hypothetical protein